MKANQIYRSLFSLLLVLAVLVSCIGTAFATAKEEEAPAAQPVTKGVAVKDGSGEMIVADWVHDYTIANRGAENLMSDYAKAGITDVYLLVKGTAGKVGWTSSVSGSVQASNGDILKSACAAGKKYGIRVHAWIMAGHDDNYLNNIDKGAMAYHFRVGYGSEVNQRMNLRDQGYRDYTAKLVKELVTNYDIAGIHLDCIRYFELYYDWGKNARDELLTNYGITIDQYNAATKAMCKRGGYSYTMNTSSTPGYNNGATYSYVAYASSGTSSSSCTTFATVLSNSSYGDAYKGAQAFMALRTDTVTGFVETVKEAAGEGIIISCAIMPEPIENTFSKCLYGQDVAKLGEVCDYVTPMAYATQYQKTSSWPASLSEKCAAAGANVVAGMQAFDETYTSYASDLNAEIPQVLEKAESVNANASYANILGYAFFRGATMTIGNAKYDESGSTLDIYLSNQTASADTKLVLKLQNGMTVDTSKLTNGMSDKTDFVSGTSFSVSSDKKTITISRSGNSVLSSLSAASMKIAVTGSPSTTYGAVQLTSYKGSSYTEGKSFCVTAAMDAGIYDGITKGTCTGAHTDIETWTDGDGNHFAFCYNCLTDLTEACVVETTATDGYTSCVCVGGYNSTTGLTDVDAHSENGGCGYSYIASDSLYLHFNADSIANKTADWNAKTPHSMTGEVDTTRGILYGSITGSDPYIFTNLSGDEMHYNISADHIIEIRAKTEITGGTAKGMQVFFTTPTHTGYDESYSVDNGNVAHGSDEYQVIRFSFDSAKDYIGKTLTGLRVDPMSISGEAEIAASYEIDYIYIGPADGAPSAQNDSELYFSFDNDAAAMLRYNGIVYGGRNFDLPTEGYWATASNGSAKNFSVDNKAGTLNVSVGATADSNGEYGVWVETTAKHNCYPWGSEPHYSYYPLSFNPGNSDYVQVRFKLNGCEEVSGKSATVSVVCDYIKDGSYGVCGDMFACVDVDAEGFQTVKIPVKDSLKSADAIKSLALRFQNIKSADDGTIIIDYIHMGAKDSLYFDFSNTEADVLRYSGKTYGDNNFDTGNWVGRTDSVKDLSYDNENGTLSFSSKDASQSYHYVQTSTTGHTTDNPLCYVPSEGDSIQLCFKIENAAINGDASLKVHYMTDELTQISDHAVTSIALDASYLDGKYHLVSLPLNKSFISASFISALRVGFSGISSAEGGTATFTLDYIYVGAEDTLPHQNSLFFDFTGDDAASHRYSTRTYGNTDFDTKDNWARSQFSTFGVSDGTLTGTIIGSAFIRTAVGASVQAAQYPLYYQPGSDDYLQVRFKIEDSTAQTAKLKMYYYIQEQALWDSFPSVSYAIGSGYVIATVPLAGTSFVDAEVIRGIQLAFDGVSDGKLTVDYIYVGPKAEQPVSDKLFFDFTNTTADLKRYDSKTYGNVNYDDAKTVQWRAYTTDLAAATAVVDNESGTLTARSAQDGISSMYVDTSIHLSYDLGEAEILQIRLKMDHFSLNGSKTPYVNVHFFGNDSTAVAKTEAVELTEAQLTSDAYLLLNIPVTDDIRGAGEISRLRIYLGNVSGDATSVITVDTVFVGKEKDQPFHDHLLFDFTNTADDLARYDSKTYGNVNFDTGNWQCNSNRNNAPVYQAAEGLVSTTVVGVAPYLQTVSASGSLGSAPLTFVPGEDTELVQLRISLTGLEPVVSGTSGQIIVHLMTEDSGEVITDASLRYPLQEAELSGEFITVNLNAGDFLSKLSGIYALRVTASNLQPAEGATGEMAIDYIYVGSRAKAPSGQVCFVDFYANDGQTVVQRSSASAGSPVEYKGAMPEKESDETYHYSFVGWMDENGNAVDLSDLTLTADIKLYPDYSASTHTMRYTMTIDETGETVEFHYCSACDFNLACGHIWNEGSVSTPPTCTAPGTVSYGCTMCAAKKSETIAATGHSVVADAAIAATCTVDGLSEGSHCSVCGEVLVAQEVIPASGHAVEYYEEKAPGCTEDGHIAYYECSLCHRFFMDLSCTIEVPESYLASPATGHSYGYENKGENHTITCANCDYAATEAHNFVDGTCICGAVEITGPTLDATLSFGAQLYLENDLTMAFRVKGSKLANYDVSTAYLVVERDIYATGATEAVVETMTITDYTVSADGRYVFSYPGIAAAQMNDAIRATLYIKDAQGKEYVSPVLNTSVATYLDGLLSNSTSDTKLMTLILDMVNYGAAAQVYFDRHADAPVNEAFESFKTYASYASADFTTILEDLSGTTANEGATGKLNQGLDLGTRIGIQYKVTIPTGVNAEDVTLVITDAKGNELETIEVVSGTIDSRGRYIVNFYGSTSKDMRRVVYATAYANGSAITGTYAYSISTYAWGIQENASAMDANLVSVTRAMMLYGDSALAYFG